MHPFCSRPLRRAALGLVTALAVCAAVPEAGGAQINALLGTWTLVPERSMATPGPLRYRSLTLTFSATEQGLKNKATGIDAGGQPIDSTFLIVEDGKYHPVTGATRFDSSSYTRLGDRNTVYVRRKHRDTVVVASRSLSSDGQTLMFREKTIDDLGREVGRALLVFEKQKRSA